MANISKQKRDEFIAKIESLKQKKTIDDSDRLLLNDIINELNEKKYGLIWEQHSEAVDEMMKTNIPVFKEDTDKKIVSNPELPYNFLLEGDNLHSLKLLEKTHKGKIDVIYIDPPYNTGNKDFKYNDTYIDSEDGYSHSKWLSFMNERLEIAKKLLSVNSLIFISIDDNEQANLKILCDNIFGEENFVANIINQSANSVFGSKAAHKDKTFIKVKDYVLVYKKGNIKLQPLYTPSNNYLYTNHEFIIDKGKKITTTDWFKNNYASIFEKYDLSINKQSIQQIMEFNPILRKEIMEKLLDIQFSTSPYSKNDLSESEINKLSNGEIIEHNGIKLIREGNGTGLIRFLRPLRESCKYINGEWLRCDILGDVWNTSAGYGNINAEGAVKFANGKKPLMLLKQLLIASNNKNALILDFFAGSGTTGHAVMELNTEDGGNRKFILCTNNENNICEDVTYQRLKTVITGTRKDGSKYSDGIPANLKYYKTDFVSKVSEDDDYYIEDELTKHIKEMIELENAVELDNDRYVLLLSDEDADAFEQEMKNMPIEKVYIDSTIMLSRKAQDYLESKKVEVIPIPDYYFYKDIIVK